MPFGGSSIPTIKDNPAPTYQETVTKNQGFADQRQLSLTRAIGAQQQLGANQLKAGGSGLRY